MNSYRHFTVRNTFLLSISTTLFCRFRYKNLQEYGQRFSLKIKRTNSREFLWVSVILWPVLSGLCSLFSDTILQDMFSAKWISLCIQTPMKNTSDTWIRCLGNWRLQASPLILINAIFVSKRSNFWPCHKRQISKGGPGANFGHFKSSCSS